MVSLLVALAASLAPANAIPLVANRALARARDRWLLSVLTLGTVWLAFQGEYAFALISLWHLCVWPQKRDAELGETGLAHEHLSTLVLWIAIGAMWFLLKTVPLWAYDYIRWAWLLVAVGQVAILVAAQWLVDWPADNRPRLGKRAKGTFGSPVLTAIYLAAVVPLAPWWLAPVFAVGLYLTWSYTALVGLSVAVVALQATIWWGVAIPIALALLFWARCNPKDIQGKATYRTQRLFESTPRGDSVDGWRGRWVEDILLLRTWWQAPWRMWLLGFGPGSAAVHTRIWSSRQSQELPTGEAHADGLQHLYEYGALGGLAGAVFLVTVGQHLRLGDMWSAAWLSLLAMSLVHWPCRHPSLAPTFLILSARLVGA